MESTPDSPPEYEMISYAQSQPDGNESAESDSLDDLLDDLASVQGEENQQKGANAKSTGTPTATDDMLNTDVATGLQKGEVDTRRKRFGMNELPEKKRNHFRTFVSFFVGPIQFVMAAAAILSLSLQKWVDFGVIIALLVLNAVVGWAQDYQACNIVKELQKTLTKRCRALHDGQLAYQEARLLVPGDIVVLDEGTVVPADGKLRISSKGPYLQVDQSAITGESMATDKKLDDVLYQSSVVKHGEGRMIVTSTGTSTYVGRSAMLVSATASSQGQFTQVVNSIGMILLALVVLTLAVVVIVCSTRSKKLREIFTLLLSIVIVGVPVGLPAVVTTTMAVGASFLAKKKAIFQRLSTIETLARVDILCSDKTGTLTQNKLTLGQPYTVERVSSSELVLCACLAASHKMEGLDPIDKAFLKALRHYPQAKLAMSRFREIYFTPFNAVSKHVSATVESPDGQRITCVKGAPAVIMDMVSEESTVDPSIVRDYNDVVSDFAERGFRALGVARKRQGKSWELLGVIPCSDPLRFDTVDVITEAKGLGLKIQMLTGDAIGIAKEISQGLGIGSKIYKTDGLELGDHVLATSEAYDFVQEADGFAEMFPQHKYNIIDILQRRGFVVAMTGDGVNDAPALKKADAGIAVEDALDAARSAADIVFLAPGLGAIIDALKTSRQIFHRMHAYVVYRIAVSLHLLLFFGTFIIFKPNKTLNITLILFVAIFADIATLAIAYDNAPYSQLPVRWNIQQLWCEATILGVILAAGSWLTMFHLRKNPTFAQDSLLFLQIVLSQSWVIFITRASGRSWRSIPSWQLVLAVFTVDALAVVICFFGWFSEDCHGLLKGCQPLPMELPQIVVQAVTVWAIMAIIFLVVEGSSFRFRHKKV